MAFPGNAEREDLAPALLNIRSMVPQDLRYPDPSDRLLPVLIYVTV